MWIETRGRGPDVVLLHGWAMNSTVWNGIVDELAQHFCVHLVDLPGHGASPAASPLSLQMMVDAVDAAFPWGAQVIGWSLGGAVAAQWALQQPEKVKSLTLVASSPCFMQRDDWRAAMPSTVLAQFAEALQSDWQGTLKRFISLQAMGDASARAVTKELLADLFKHGEPSVAALSEGLVILRDTDLREQISQILCPVLLQYGDRDTLTPLPAGHWLKSQLSDAQLFVHQGAAHAPFLSHRDDFLAAQLDFLTKN
ncbi:MULTISPECIES: pimeloyl-ACP methyl ester esterase BioH [Deefgea]|uniref:Pimeloyl-[acyl-carrier protein] methyl ester esterase n=1 Tax=Deefgea chitinilytica TaxID=570276 RepID=A0ABS2C7N5_9NEIS|nr:MULTISPECIES: pimeloyl-ACP methyl ester esterase BioH [Deefgea]MBM5570168.1 pimeloyl-ACP methyl ester esterase BioH [Deefgea chitinilytica]MBM9887397.1 pimeloyl-ACP methyl ester esterase BioH [Deefgea sp. CFH1-16]